MIYFLRLESLKISVMNGCLLLPVFGVAFYDLSLAAQLAFMVGTVWLSVLLVVPRMRRMRFFERFDGQLLPIARNSKWLGLWTAAWFWLHAVLVWMIGVRWTVGLSPLLASLCIFVVLTLISNKWSYAHVGWWKQINMLVWMVPPLMLGYMVAMRGDFTSTLPFVVAVVLYPTVVLSGLTGVLVAKPDYFARMRLVYLLVAIVAAGLCVFMA